MLERITQQWATAPLWQRLLILIIAPLVIIGAIYFYNIKPNMEKKKQLELQAAQLKQEIDKYSRLIQPGALRELEEQLKSLLQEEEKTRAEVEKVVGKIPTKEEIERILGEINFMAGIRDLVITRIAVSQPRVANLLVVEAGEKKIVKLASQNRRNQQGNRGQAQQTPQGGTPGVPVTMMEVQMTLEGKTSDLYGFLESLYRKGLVSYPKSVRISPVKNANIVTAQVVIDIILQR